MLENEKYDDSSHTLLLLGDEVSLPFHPEEIANSWRLSSFLLLNSMIGAGILNQPYVFMTSGIMGGLVGFLFASFFTFVGLMLLVEAGVSHNVLEYAGVAKRAFGTFGEKLVDFGILLSAFGAQLSYMIVIGDTGSQLLMSWGCQSNICDQIFVIIFTSVVFVCPICLFRHFGHLAYLSLFSLLAIILCLFLVIIGGPIVTQHNVKPAVNWFDFVGMISSTGSIVFALSCAAQDFQAFVATEKKSQNVIAWTKVTGVAVFSGAILCVIMGVAGYLCFGDNTNGEILNNFPGSGYDFFKMMIVAHLILYIPVNFIVMRYSLVKLTVDKRSEDLPSWQHVTVTLSLLLMITLTVIVFIEVGFSSGRAFAVILTLTGGVAGSLLSFILPGAIYMKLMPRDSSGFIPAALCSGFGVFVLFAVVVVTAIKNT